MFTEVPRAFLEAENIIADQSARAATRYLLEFTYPAGICGCGPGVPGVGGSQRIKRGGLPARWYRRVEARTIALLSNRAGDFDGHSNMRRLAGGPLDLRLCDREYAAPEYGGQPLWPVHVPHLNGQQYSCKPRYALRRHRTIVLADRHRSDRQVDGRRGAAQLGPVAHHHALSGRGYGWKVEPMARPSRGPSASRRPWAGDRARWHTASRDPRCSRGRESSAGSDRRSRA